MVQFTNDDLREAGALLRAIERELPSIVTASGSSDWFLFYDPDGVTDPAKRFPFATIVTGDRYDAASHLDRDQSTYRLNLGIDRASYEQLFGPAPRQPAGYDVIDTGFDYTAVDTVLPHPLYAPLHWVCVVNPTERGPEDSWRNCWKEHMLRPDVSTTTNIRASSGRRVW